MRGEGVALPDSRYSVRNERVKGCEEDPRNLMALFTPAKLLVHLFFLPLNVIPTAVEVEYRRTPMHCWSGWRGFNRVRPMPDPPKWVIAWTESGGFDGPRPAKREAELKGLRKSIL